MELSDRNKTIGDILGFPKTKGSLHSGSDEADRYSLGYNHALMDCDREIDREALAKELYKEFCDEMAWENTSEPTKIIFRGYAVGIISTMPTWLKRSKK